VVDGRQTGISANVKFAGRGVSAGDFPQIVFFVVRIYYLKNAIYQGFRQNWPVKYCAMYEPNRRKFLPNLSIDDEEQESKSCKSNAIGAVGRIETFRVHGCRP
jgi:hypothetical protein